MSQKQVTKYRPTMSAHLIQHAVNLAKLEQPMSLESVELIGILAPFLAKIENGAKVGIYSMQPKVSIEQQIGLELPTNEGEYSFQGKVYLVKEEYWAACYNQYTVEPRSLSLNHILAAKEHMYLNDLMSPEEMEEFEQAAFVAK